MNPFSASAVMMFAGATKEALDAIPKLIEISKAINLINAKLEAGEVLSVPEEQQYQQMSATQAELATQITQEIQRGQAVDETGRTTEAYELGADQLAEGTYKLGKARMDKIGTKTDALVAKRDALASEGRTVQSEFGGGLMQDASTMAGVLAQQSVEKTELDDALFRIKLGEMKGVAGAAVDFDDAKRLLKERKVYSDEEIAAFLKTWKYDPESAALLQVGNPK